MVVRRLDLEERVDLDNVEGTSEASLAASVPRVSTDALPTQEPGPGPDRARQRRQVESGTAEQRSELMLRRIRRLLYFREGTTPSGNYPNY